MYAFVSEDSQDGDIFYYIKWGDETFEDWFGPFKSGEEITISHNWSAKAHYTIKARAKTTSGLMGSWGEFELKISKNKAIQTSPFLNFLQSHPNLFPLLQLLLQRLEL